ncbi:uncharacterized protein LOC122808774 [Protopterus annectens]|uniref:uncharacterized protein LOC122808774 n=1 Tax=Protopterus annectens TaxID=7888 RepID=UPI001CFAFB05|nr:uncharacterized protein LOC122808774 [Protopterus annectens]XP_043935750.1 uncharacterized protein LOC122808774 [Protopterus annectens]
MAEEMGKILAAEMGKILADKKDTIEHVMEIFEKGAEALASVVGEIFPFMEIVSPVVQLALNNIDNGEADYIKEQFQIVRDKLDSITEEIQNINQEIEKSKIDLKYFEVEEAIQNQFRKFMDILNAKPQYRNVKKDLFLDHFSKSGGEKNLYSLCSAVMGDSTFGESILVIALKHERQSRRVIEDLCARLKELFCIGLIALMGYATISGGDETEKIKVWNNKIQDIENKMKSVVDECIKNFVEQAKNDTHILVRERGEQNNQQFADFIHDFLKKKYYWVNWCVFVFNQQSNTSFSEKVKDRWFHNTGCHIIGPSQLATYTLKDVNVVISYSVNPECIDKYKIRQLMESKDRELDAVAVAEYIYEHMPHCMVQTICRYRNLWGSWSFQKGCFYWENYKKTYPMCSPKIIFSQVLKDFSCNICKASGNMSADLWNWLFKKSQ